MSRWIFLVVALACLPTIAEGGVISRDWKTPGDGLLTYDDVNHREWLDLTESRLSMFPGSTLEQRYQNALLELVPGGMFEGFIAAKEVDLLALAQSAGINVLTDEDFVTNQIPTMNLIASVGVSENFGGGQVLYSFGQLDELGSFFGSLERKLGVLRVSQRIGFVGQAGVTIRLDEVDHIAAAGNTGVWLYRQVPEPCGIVLVACAVLFVAAFRMPTH